jgi:hypothetical protein
MQTNAEDNELYTDGNKSQLLSFSDEDREFKEGELFRAIAKDLSRSIEMYVILCSQLQYHIILLML